MDFPTTGAVIRYLGIFVFTGPCLLLVATWCLVGWYRTPKQKMNERAQSLFAGMWLLLIGLAHITLYPIFFSAAQYRFDPSIVVAIRVEHILHENGPAVEPAVIFSDTLQIHRGLMLLAAATGRRRNHESFDEGYRLQFQFAGTSTFSSRYLSVYPNANGGGAIIPHFGPPSANDTSSDVGEYSSPQFVAWTEATLTPLFAKNKDR
jgi:hypothetical protein